MANDNVSHSYILNCLEPAYSYDHKRDERYEHLDSLMRAMVIRVLHCTLFFSSKKSVIFLRNTMWLCRTTAAENENGLVSHLTNVWDKVLQPRYVPVALSCFYNAVSTC